MFKINCGIVAALLVSHGVFAADVPPTLMKKLTELSPEITPEQVAASPIEGLYEVTLGAYVVYMSEDGQHMLRGDLIETASGRNVTEERRFSARQAVIRDVDEDSMIVFAPEQVKHTVTVFTDVDCGYCAKLHSEMKQYTDLGISVRYLAFPRAGIDSESYDKTVSVWCADDPHEAITVAKRGESVAPKQCDNPVSSHYDLGREMGVRGTPTIVLESGEIIPGYVPADRLLAELSKPGG